MMNMMKRWEQRVETNIFEYYETMTLNAKNGKRNGYAYITRKMALNAYESDGSESLCKKVSLNDCESDGSERLWKLWL